MNEAARLVTLTPRKRSKNGTIRPVSITPVLQKLHWLPIAQRIEYKVLTTTYKAMHGSGPEYIRELLVPYVQSRTLRSAKLASLLEPKYGLKSAGYRCFEVGAPRWNKLPVEIRNAQSLLSSSKA